MKTEFLGQAYSLRSLPLSAQTLVNLYPEMNQSQSGEIGAFYGTPGLTLRVGLAQGTGRALGVSGGDDQTLYAVVGDGIWTIDTNFNATLIDTFDNISQFAPGRVSICSNDTQTAIATWKGWSAYSGTTSLGSVANAPANSILTYMDGYVIFTDGGGKFGITAINDLTSISALDVATAEALPDDLIAVYADQREVWLVGNDTTEIWSDTGALAFPFERIPGGVINVGCAAAYSVAFLDGSLFWLTRDRTGNCTVIRTVGYQVTPVSNHALEEEFSSYSTVSDAFAFGYQDEGHAFYQITFPTADKTWVYDCATRLWHRRAYRDSNGVLHRHRASAYAFFNGQHHVVLDQDNGNIYTMDLNTYTDNGTPIYRERAWPLIAPQEMHRMRCDELELVAETGVGNTTDPNPQVWLDMSYDGGSSYGVSRYQTLGKIGSRYSRARWRRNGLGRRPVARVATTMQAKVSWIGANVTGEILGQ